MAVGAEAAAGVPGQDEANAESLRSQKPQNRRARRIATLAEGAFCVLSASFLRLMKPVALNRKAYHDYFVEETYEAGIQLFGTEVKSLRSHSVDMSDGYARVEGGEVYMYDVHVAPYSHGNVHNRNPKRRRKLLLKKEEIRRLFGKTQLRGLTMIPLKIYFSARGLAKVELGLCRGKKDIDRREVLKKRALEREDRAEFRRR